MKAGTVNVDMKEEEILWFDKKRTPVFGLPLSFTKYTLTETKLIMQSGLFFQKEEEVKLYRCLDISLRQGFLERLNKTGTIIIKSSDVTTPELRLIHVKNARQIKEILSQRIEVARTQRDVRTSECVNHCD